MGIFYDSECSRSVYNMTGALWLILFPSQTNIRAKKLRTGRWTRFGTQIRPLRNVNEILILRPPRQEISSTIRRNPIHHGFPRTLLVLWGLKYLCLSVPQNFFRGVKCPFLLVIKIRHFWKFIRTFLIPTAGEDINGSRKSINPPLSERSRRRRGRCVVLWLKSVD